MNLLTKLIKTIFMSDKKNNTGSENSGNYNSGNRNSGNYNNGDYNSGYYNSGYCNSGNRNNGGFNTTEPTAVFFGKDTRKKWDEITHPHWMEFYTTKWISENDMTADEKIADPNYFVRGGYLKTYAYKEAWANFWRDTDEENRKKFLALPNFDTSIFLEITGIDVDAKGCCHEGADKKWKYCPNCSYQLYE